METRASSVNGPATGPFIRRFTAVASIVLCSVTISACASGIKQGHFDSVVDPTTTGSIQKTNPVPQEREKLSDETTIRNAVSSVNLEELGADTLSWANIDTGSRGAITEIAEFRDGEARCRKFVASRESYEGITLFNGVACLRADGEWTMVRFSAI